MSEEKSIYKDSSCEEIQEIRKALENGDRELANRLITELANNVELEPRKRK